MVIRVIKMIKLLTLHDINPSIQVSNLTSGVYHIRLITSNGKVNVVNFNKE